MNAEENRARVFGQCTRSLSFHRRRPVRQWLEDLAASPHAAALPDEYGKGELIAALEARVAELLGKEAAVFSPKGVIAQQAALRVLADRSGSKTVILHPKSHFEADEDGAIQRLHDLRPLRVGDDFAPFTLKHLAGVAERVGALTVELPLRRTGYRLPAWEELEAIGVWAKGRGIPFHIDGARLWECGPWYGRSYAEIAAVADSVYVSFYKGLGGLAGCALAGPADFIAEARVWLNRHGSFLMTSFPMVIAAMDGLDRHLPRMPAYCARAREIAAGLAAIPGVRIEPAPPQTHAFQIYLPGTIEAWEAATLELAEREKLAMFRRFSATPFANTVMTEVAVGEAAEDMTTPEIIERTAVLVAIAGSSA